MCGFGRMSNRRSNEVGGAYKYRVVVLLTGAGNGSSAATVAPPCSTGSRSVATERLKQTGGVAICNSSRLSATSMDIG